MQETQEPKTEADPVRHPSSRRDVRYRVREGASVACTTPLAESGALEAVMTTVCVAGLGFEVEGDPICTPGTRLAPMTVRAGDCAIRGEAVVRSVRVLGAARFEIGCLFVPESPAAEDRWMALISGVEIALGLRGV